MPETSAGVILYRRVPHLQILIGHMGGPFWAKKDAAAWSIPKGLYKPGEPQLAAALREFGEELGHPAPDVDYMLLGKFRQPSGKLLTVFAAEADLDVSEISSNTFEAEWPPRSGRIQDFPEMDRAGWFAIDEARGRVVKGQLMVIDALMVALGSS